RSGLPGARFGAATASSGRS
ncbi:hypothetical protein ATHL_00027, partial [Anaerolinea thermolimosa]